jgi:hypothetical protein
MAEEADPAAVQQRLDMEMARLVAQVDQLKADLQQAEQALHDCREQDMAARRALITRATGGDQPAER